MWYIQNIQNVYIIYGFEQKCASDVHFDRQIYILEKHLHKFASTPIWKFLSLYARTTNEWNGVLLLFSIIHISRYLSAHRSSLSSPSENLTTKYHLRPVVQSTLQLNNSQWENSWKLCCKAFISPTHSLFYLFLIRLKMKMPSLQSSLKLMKIAAEVAFHQIKVTNQLSMDVDGHSLTRRCYKCRRFCGWGQRRGKCRWID